MASIEITDTGRSNVVSKGYLHSTTFNFRNAVAVGLETSRFFMDNKYYNDIEKKLINIRDSLISKEDSFYSYFGINTGDSSRNAFMFNQLLKSSLEKYEVLKKMNSSSFFNSLDDKLNEMIQFVANYFQDKLTDSSVDIEKIINPVDLESFFDESLKLLNKIYYLTFGEKSQLRKVFLKNGQRNKTFEVRFGEIYKTLSKETEQISENKSSEFINNMIYFLKPDHDLEILMRKSFNKVKDKLNISTYEKNNRIGIIGEVQAGIIIDLLLDSMADDAPKSFYVGNLYDSGTKKQSPIDFLVGKYGIQVKNTMEAIENSTIKPFYDIKLQTSVSLDTFISRLDSSAEEFRYLVTNVAWLRNNGLNENQKEDKLKFSDIPLILEYINNILSINAEKLLHTEATKVLNKQGKVLRNTYGNTFFLLKGRYLIPISVMVDGMIKTLREQNEAESSGIGFFSRTDLGVSNKKGKEIKLNSSVNLKNAIAIQNKKHEILSRMGSSGELNMDGFDYSGELLDYGSSLGDDLSSGMNIRVNYKFITENLNKLENNLRLW